MPDFVKISELTNGTKIQDGENLVYESTGGTKRISYKDFMESIIPGNAGAHNSIYRGENLTSRGVAEICNRINNGTFDDLFIGDYFDVKITVEGGTEEIVRCVLAGFDMYYRNGDTELTKHHAVVVPKNCFTTLQKMNETNVTDKGYAGSAMHTTVLPKYYTALNAATALNGHILKYKDLLTTEATTTGASMAGANYQGYSSKWAWSDVNLRLMSEVQVYGSTVFSSSFYDVGAANLQLPIFRLCPEFKLAGAGGTESTNRTWYWLSAVASSAVFADVGGSGVSASGAASVAAGCRPLFLIGNP